MEIWLAIFGVVIVALGLYLLARRRRSISPDDSDGDPEAGAPAKVKSGPGGKSGTTALKEPDEQETI
jgi:LPXTG-motif cell wall-anchored protein